jgi:hypothetical protein
MKLFLAWKDDGTKIEPLDIKGEEPILFDPNSQESMRNAADICWKQGMDLAKLLSDSLPIPTIDALLQP